MPIHCANTRSHQNMCKIRFLILLLAASVSTYAQKDPHWVEGRNTIVHLFEWKWSDIARECEDFLSVRGFAGVQTSPPSENLIVSDRPWWERYQVVSYQLTTRSGNEAAFADMVKRCNAVGIRIYPDIVFNHMTGGSGIGTAESSADANNKYYPSVPFSEENFHATCSINNYDDPVEVRNCELDGLKDLDQSQDYVRQKIIEYLDHLVELGVAGFRVDAAKHMWPTDLEVIYSSVRNLNTEHGFPENARPFVYQEVIDVDGGAVQNTEYLDFGTVVEFKFGVELSIAFQGDNPLTSLVNWGPEWGLVDRNDGVVFIENHDNQRADGTIILTYKKPKPYKTAIAFMLAHPYTKNSRIMSSFAFTDRDQGPPNSDGDIISPTFDENGVCNNGWVCEHRWGPIYNMVEFRKTVEGTDLNSWWSNGDNQIAFGRGNEGFFAATVGGDYTSLLPTQMPDGTYCDVISGSLIDGRCTGKTVNVSGGQVGIQLFAEEDEASIAIHVNAKL